VQGGPWKPPAVSIPVLRVDPAHPDPVAIGRAVHVLRAGGLVAFPTETVYGLGARALDPAAVARIFEAKGRPSTHPIIAHVLGEKDARALAASFCETASRLARAFWPGPLTLVVLRASGVPASLGGGTDSVGIRSPAHRVARVLLEALEEPIAAPSANRYQALSPTCAEHVVASLGDRVDLVLDGGPTALGLESTVLDVRGPVPVILRPGLLGLAALRSVDPRVVYANALPTPEGASRPSPGMDGRHYAPRARVVVATSCEEARAEAERREAKGEAVGLLLRGPLRDEGRENREAVTVRITRRTLPDDPEAYARDLYATLHELDGSGVAAIVIQGVPDHDVWRAVADRLARASSR
jgi:L-threonylcarbamoyladenylate synthase